jgi:glycosyltransferase involved in cell wall biosynthesis
MRSERELGKGEGRRVVVFGSYAPSLITFRGPLIREMVRRGHEVFAVAPDLSDEICEQVRALGAEAVELQLGRGSLNPLRALATARKFGALMRELRPDTVIAYTITPIVLGAAAAKRAGAKRFVALVTGLGYAFTGGREPKRLLSFMMGKLMYRRALRHADIAVFQNPDDREEFRRLGLLPAGLPTAIINGSGIELARFPLADLPGKPSFLMIARFLKDKGVREYGEAAGRLKREFPEVEVRLVGWLDESPDVITHQELEQIAAGGVEVVGRLEDVRPAIAECSIYVLPSYREGTPRSVLEAMAMGRAVITTDAAGCRETVVDGENGFLVLPRDVDSLHAAMRRFVQHPELVAPMGRRSREIAEAKYCTQKVNAELLHHASL